MSNSFFDKMTEQLQQPLMGNLEAFQQAWQSAFQKNMECVNKPDVSIEELDKRINELKNVENWLNLNLSILKNTIQGLELQRSNLVSFQEMMQNNQALQTAGQQWWQSLNEQFSGFLQAQADVIEKHTAQHTPSRKTKSKTNKS